MANNLEFKEGSIVQAKDFDSKWLQAKIIQIDIVNNRAKIHYIDQDSRFDEWVVLTEENIKVSEQSE